MTHPHLVLKPALLALLTAFGCAAHAVPVSASDAFTGASITGLVNAGAASAPGSFDGGRDFGQQTFFNDQLPNGTVGSIAFSTGTAVTLTGIRLYAGYDEGGFGNRAMSAFRFFVDAQGDGSYTQLVAQAIDPRYGSFQVGNAAQASNELELTFMFTGPVTASHWMYEVTQSGGARAFSGVRVIELDAITAANTVPEPASLALAGLGLAGALVSRRRRQAR